MQYLKRFFKRWLSSRMNTTLVITILLGVVVFLGIQQHKVSLLAPGPLTAIHPNNQEIQGHVSHAEFEKECSHCHGPIHCVIDTKCQGCHIEVAQERADNTGLHGMLPGADDCEACHADHKGRDDTITSFAYANIDHQRLANFSLVRHELNFEQQPMNCQSCHSQASFAATSLDCLSCHAEEDHDALVAHIDLFGSDCLACHDGEDRYSDFQHAQVYPLDGAHADTDCAACHQDQTFTGIPQDCHACHEDPAIHAGIFGFKCERCHATTAWLPAEIKAHTFLTDHVDEGVELTCETCHEHTYTQYPCYSCHDQQEMQDYHAREDIYAFENCIDCHPTGRENEGSQFIESGSLVSPLPKE